MSRETARKVLEIESRAILELRDRVDASFDRAVEISRPGLLLCCVDVDNRHNGQAVPPLEGHVTHLRE